METLDKDPESKIIQITSNDICIGKIPFQFIKQNAFGLINCVHNDVIDLSKYSTKAIHQNPKSDVSN